MAAASCFILCTKRTLKRRYWVRPSLKTRTKYSTATDFLTDLAKYDMDTLSGEIQYNGGLKIFARIKSSDFEYLINKIGNKIGKKTTPFRD